MHSDDQLAKMPISEVVNLPGGNGLASPAFHMFRILRWEHVEEGVEALVCDGQLVPRTTLTVDWLRAIGKNRFFRRVLLQPAPLTNISAKALTEDGLDLTLTVSVKYMVVNPVYVAALQSPLVELTDLIIGLVAEYIRSDTLDSIVADDGKLRTALKRHLENAPTLNGHYAVTEILKAIPSGDESLLEIARQKRIAETQSGLIDIEGRNRVMEAGYQHEIDSQAAHLQDEMADRKHQRDMQAQRAKLVADVQQSALKAISDIASSGGNLKEVLPLLSRAVPGTTYEPPADPNVEVPLIETRTPSNQASRVERERAALLSLQTAGQIKSFEVFETQHALKGATVKVHTYEIIFTCPDTYPTDAPSVSVRLSEGNKFEPRILWISGVSETLAQLVVSVIPQVKTNESDSSTGQSAYRLSLDDVGGGG